MGVEGGVDYLEVGVGEVVEVNTVDGGAEVDVGFGAVLHGDHFDVFD